MLMSLYFLIGACSGFLAGLLGLGGGIIIVPALAMTFAKWNVMPSHYMMHMAVGTSLSTVVITFLASLNVHVKLGSVCWDTVKRVLPSTVVGVIAGAMISKALSSLFLQAFFGVFLLWVAYRIFDGNLDHPSRTPLSRWVVSGCGCLIGGLAGMLGVGGGLMLIPFFIRCGMNLRQATGTSVACGVFISIIASICFMLFGQLPVDLPWSTGFIYWPAFFGIAAASVLFAPLGATVAYQLPIPVLKRALALLLVLIAFTMLKPLLLRVIHVALS